MSDDQSQPDGAQSARPMPLLIAGEGIFTTWALTVASKLSLADLLVAGPKTAVELASELNAHAGAVGRLLRLLAVNGVVSEIKEGRFELTNLGQFLRSDVPGSVRPWFIMNEPINRVLVERPLDSVITGLPSFEAVFGSPFFEYGKHNPEWSAYFDQAMTAVGVDTARAVAAAYDFSALGSVIDIGGGLGALLTQVLKSHPHLIGTIFEQAHVVEAARKALARAGLANRTEVVAGDFFERIPAGFDVYVLSWIIHDWDDEQANQILANCRKAMKTSARLLLVESIIPPGDGSHFAKTVDIAMLVALGGRERTEDEYSDLLAKSGMTLARVIPTESPMNVLEAFPS